MVLWLGLSQGTEGCRLCQSAIWNPGEIFQVNNKHITDMGEDMEAEHDWRLFTKGLFSCSDDPFLSSLSENWVIHSKIQWAKNKSVSET